MLGDFSPVSVLAGPGVKAPPLLQLNGLTVGFSSKSAASTDTALVLRDDDGAGVSAGILGDFGSADLGST